MTQEYDEKYEQLNQEYVEIKSKPGFTLNDHLYRKFCPLQSAHEELFRYGIYNAVEVKEKISFAITILKIPDEYLTEQINAIFRQSKQQLTHLPNTSLNGRDTEKKLQTS